MWPRCPSDYSATVLETSQPRGMQSAKRRATADRLAASPRGGIISCQQIRGSQSKTRFSTTSKIGPFLSAALRPSKGRKDNKRAGLTGWLVAPELDKPPPPAANTRRAAIHRNIYP